MSQPPTDSSLDPAVLPSCIRLVELCDRLRSEWVAGRRARAEDLDAVLIKMRAAGAQITSERDGLRLRAPQAFDAVDLVTAPFPGFPTDIIPKKHK